MGHVLAYQPVCTHQGATWHVRARTPSARPSQHSGRPQRVTNPRNWKRRMDMTRIGVSRRKALEAGACALAGAAGLLVTARARAGTEQSTTYEEIVRRWYKAWEKKDQPQFEALMADNF